MPMGARHFYDPINTTHYITDLIGGSKDAPNVDAISWALDSNENQFSFYHGKLYFQYALASDNPERDGYYGCAWRSVGETMHIVTDLTVPAHVRNDGHPLSEPIESATSTATVLMYRKNAPAVLDYGLGNGRNLSSVMKDVAIWTNTNFVSADTIPPTGAFINDHKPAYALPLVASGPDNDGYYSTLYDGEMIKAFRRALSWRYGSESLGVRDDVLAEQQARLLPTAIRASEAVLDAFLPRFAVTVDGVRASTDASVPGYVVNAHITHFPTSEWPANSFPDGSIRNGAYIRVYHASGTYNDYRVPLCENSPATSLNYISTVVRAQTGDEIAVIYDFGGYLVYSEKYAITGTMPTPAPTAKPTPGPSYSREYEGSYREVDVPVFTYSGGTTETLGLLLPEDPLRPGQSFLLTVFQQCTGGSSTSPRMLPVDDRGRLFELYTGRNATLTINTGGLAVQDFSQSVHANGAYVESELPFAVKNNAKPGSYTVTVTVADEYGMTRSAAFEIMVA